MDNKYLKLARAAAEEKNSEDAKKYYDMARTEDPENPEAKFYYQYYNLMDSKNMEILSKYENVINSVIPTIKLINKSDMQDGEKEELIIRIVDDFLPLRDTLCSHLLSLSSSNLSSDGVEVMNRGSEAHLALGKALKEMFGDKKPYITKYVEILKEAIEDDFNQSNYINYKDKGKDLWIHKAAREIQKYEPSYTLPQYKQQGGCASGEAAYAKQRKEDF